MTIKRKNTIKSYIGDEHLLGGSIGRMRDMSCTSNSLGAIAKHKITIEEANEIFKANYKLLQVS